MSLYRLLVSVCLPATLLMLSAAAQPAWVNSDSLFPGLPSSMHVHRSEGKLNGRPHVAWYVEARLSDKILEFGTDTSYGRRLTPSAFYERNGWPLVVVNGTFFSFTDNRNLNVVVRNGRLVSYNIMSIPGRGRDTLLYHQVTRPALGIDRKRRADVAWLHTDSARKFPLAYENAPISSKDSTAYFPVPSGRDIREIPDIRNAGVRKRWKMRTAIGGGPVLVYDGRVRITNDQERMFYGKAREDLHPRTAMGYTADGRLLILAVEGRRPGVAEGASLTELAQIFVALGAREALNLDGGGSSCLLVMGKETIRPSDKEGQRAVPAVFQITTNERPQ